MATQSPVGVAEALLRLRLFNEKAEKLRGFSFIKAAFHPDAGVTAHFDFQNKTMHVERRGADEESTAALCLLLRFFIQRRDGIQLEQIDELYHSLPVPAEDRRLVSENLKILNTLLDAPTEIAVNGEPVTNRVILDTFMYGNLAHMNDDKRATYESWKADPPWFRMLESYFESTVGVVVKFICWLEQMNAKTIQALETRSEIQSSRVDQER